MTADTVREEATTVLIDVLKQGSPRPSAAQIEQLSARAVDALVAAGLLAAGGILPTERCPGAGMPARTVTGRYHAHQGGRPFRGTCAVCGREYRLTYDGMTYKHRRRPSSESPRREEVLT